MILTRKRLICCYSCIIQSASDVGDDIAPTNIISKLSLLVLHFPRLRIVWSRSLHATADIFAALKSNQDEPDLGRAMRVGVPTEDGLIEGDIRFEIVTTILYGVLLKFRWTLLHLERFDKISFAGCDLQGTRIFMPCVGLGCSSHSVSPAL